MSIGTLAKISGLPIAVIYETINDSSNYELYEMWQKGLKAKADTPKQEIVHIYSSIPENSTYKPCISFKPTTEIQKASPKNHETVSKEIEEIKKGIIEITGTDNKCIIGNN